MPEEVKLAGLSPGDFLREHWQKRPLLARDAVPGLLDPITPEDLAGLACEALVESRIVLNQDGESPFAVRYGPFTAEDFDKLPEKNWTLLVRHVDKIVPQVGALLEGFRFIPEWRIDDIMVSFAAPGGTVGPHVDQYDVFLIQGRGKRRWRISQDKESSMARRSDTELDVLAEFTPTEEWELEPGDMLYLPPGVPHHGVATDHCLTYSVGFRAPAADELLAGWLEHLLANIPADRRYADPDLKPVEKPGKLGKEALERVRKLLTEAMSFDEEAFRRWFGGFITADPGLPEAEPRSRPLGLERLKRQLDSGKRIRRNPLSRVCYVEEGDRALLFVAGQCHRTSLDLATRLGDLRSLSYQDLRSTLKQPDDATTLIQLINDGHWMLEDE